MRQGRMKYYMLLLVILIAVGTFMKTRSSTPLLFDGFNSNNLDINRSIWTSPTGDAAFIGRTAIRNPASTDNGSGQIPVTDGTAQLILSTFNPTALTPGDSFWGSEMDSIQRFNLPKDGNGIEFSARVRWPTTPPPGIISSLFSFGLTGTNTSDFKDEIDFEFFTTKHQSNFIPRLLTNRYSNEPPGRGIPAFATAPDINLNAFNEFSIRWYPSHIVWLVNGKKVYIATSKIPKGPLGIRLNIWVPGSDFIEAYSPALQPTSTIQDNTNYLYEVDWVKVTNIRPEG